MFQPPRDSMYFRGVATRAQCVQSKKDDVRLYPVVGKTNAERLKCFAPLFAKGSPAALAFDDVEIDKIAKKNAIFGDPAFVLDSRRKYVNRVLVEHRVLDLTGEGKIGRLIALLEGPDGDIPFLVLCDGQQYGSYMENVIAMALHPVNKDGKMDNTIDYALQNYFKDCKSETKDCKSETKDCKSKTKDCKSETKDCKSETKDCKSETKDCKSETKDCKSETKDCKSETKDCKSETKDCKSETKDCKSETKDCKSETKAMTVSNVTSVSKGPTFVDYRQDGLKLFRVRGNTDADRLKCLYPLIAKDSPETIMFDEQELAHVTPHFKVLGYPEVLLQARLESINRILAKHRVFVVCNDDDTVGRLLELDRGCPGQILIFVELDGQRYGGYLQEVFMVGVDPANTDGKEDDFIRMDLQNWLFDFNLGIYQ